MVGLSFDKVCLLLNFFQGLHLRKSQADRLLEIYRAACRVQRDRRLSDAGRVRKVAELDDAIFELCEAVWFAELPPQEGPADDYRLLVHELMRLMLFNTLGP